MTDRLRRPTMNDVASAAGVSLKSVSRVVNDEIGASPETRRKVLAAAAELGYRRTDAAHALRRADGRSASCSGCPAKSSSRADFQSSWPAAGECTLSWRTPE